MGQEQASSILFQCMKNYEAAIEPTAGSQGMALTHHKTKVLLWNKSKQAMKQQLSPQPAHKA